MNHRAFAVIVGFILLASPVLAQSTAFTYQGQLKNNGSLAEGQHDFRFRLFDAASGGTQVGTTQCADNIQVKDGVFTATMDFGNQFATPNQRFIEILVRRDTGLGCADTSGYATLAPRQPITPAPTATQAASAFSLAAPDGSPAQAVFVNNAGNVGIGTTTPGVPLQIARDIDPVLVIQDIGPANTQAGYLGFWNNAGAETGWMGFGTPGSPHMTLFNGRSTGDIELRTASGKVRLGSTGQFFATAGEENLRIVRGTVNFDGTVLRGSGFAVNRVATGVYSITFNTPFSSVPIVTATGDSTRTIDYALLTTRFVSSSSFEIISYGVLRANDYNETFSFIAVGPR